MVFSKKISHKFKFGFYFHTCPISALVVGFIGIFRPFDTFRSFRARSVNLATLFLGKHPRQFTNT